MVGCKEGLQARIPVPRVAELDLMSLGERYFLLRFTTIWQCTRTGIGPSQVVVSLSVRYFVDSFSASVRSQDKAFVRVSSYIAFRSCVRTG